MNIIAIIIMAALIAADRYTKLLAVRYLRPVGTVPLIDGVFSLTYVENTGAAFGIFQGGRWFFIILTTIILLVMLVYYLKLPKKRPYIFIRLCLILVASGAIGNFVDRLQKGYVVDFLHFTLIDFPVFNVADCFVCVGAFAMAFLLVFVIKEDV